MITNLKKIQCPLCFNSNAIDFFSNQPINREYYHCPNCDLVFVDEIYFVNRQKEKARYDLHENSEINSGYIDFLNRCIKPTLPFIADKKLGLDFGCGPGPVLSKILTEHGYNMHLYDPIYYPNFPKIKFDFVFCTEVWEHFHFPGKEIPNLLSLLNPQGILAIMTVPWSSLNAKKDFLEWYYAKDETHVSFFHEKTMEWVSNKWNLNLLLHPEERVWIWKTP